MSGCGCDGAKCRLEVGDPRHGRPTGYDYHKCRCALCTAGKRGRDARYYAENAETVRKQNARRYADNAERVRESVARYRTENMEQIREQKARYHATPQGKAVRRAAGARRRSRKRNRNCGCCSTVAMQAVWALDCGLCAYCSAPADHFEHVVPLHPWGWHCTSNLRAACASCNLRKGTKPLSVFLAQLAASGVTVREGATNSGLPCPAAAERMSRRMLTASPTSLN